MAIPSLKTIRTMLIVMMIVATTFLTYPIFFSSCCLVDNWYFLPIERSFIKRYPPRIVSFCPGELCHDDHNFENTRKVDNQTFGHESTSNHGSCYEVHFQFHPTCNKIHEIDIAFYNENEIDLMLLGSGGSWRIPWKIGPKQSYLKREAVRGSLFYNGRNNSITGMIDKKIPDGDNRYYHSSILKMLKLSRGFDDESMTNQQSDAAAMELLTSSPYILDIYGFCGASAITEYAHNDARMLLKSKLLRSRDRFLVGMNLVRGLAHLHGLKAPLTVVHNDINMGNMLRVQHSSLKFHDFNIGLIIDRNQTKNDPCMFPAQYNNSLWRAPEEIHNETYVTDKVDVYALGNVLYQVMTKHQPWTWLEPQGPTAVKDVEARKKAGYYPFIPKKICESTDPYTQALYITTIACFQHKINERPSAYEILAALEEIWNILEQNNTIVMTDMKSIISKYNGKLGYLPLNK